MRAGSHEEPSQVASVEELLTAALKTLPQKPPDTASREVKKNYSEQMSAAWASAVAEGLRHQGLATVRPAGPGDVGVSGAGIRLAGGLGAKRVDVSWSTEESGLLLAASIKSINFRDGRSRNYQKNLINRRGDLLIDAVTLHRRFPYAVLVGLMVLDSGAETDGTTSRRSTFENAFPRLRMYTGRTDPGGRDDQFERLYIALVDANKFQPQVRCFRADDPGIEVTLSDAIEDMLVGVVERNSDFYDRDRQGQLRRFA